MTGSTRWTVAMLIVVAIIVGALWNELRRPEPAPGGPVGAAAPAREHRDADSAAALAEPRARAQLTPCPAPTGDAAASALRGIDLECMGDGVRVDMARAVAGRTVVLNLWAYWCGPCAAELPAMADYQHRVGAGVTVLTVHQDENEAAGLLRLAELGVRLPTVQDGRRLIAAALSVPNVMPATVVLRPDGTVARILPRPFATADDIAGAVDDALHHR